MGNGNGFSTGRTAGAVVGTLIGAAIIGSFAFTASRASDDALEDTNVKVAENRAAINAGIVRDARLFSVLNQIDKNTRGVDDDPAVRPTDMDQPELLK